MTAKQGLRSFIVESPLIRCFSLFMVLPLFVLQLCLYLNVNDRPPGPALFFLADAGVFFGAALLLYIATRIAGLFAKNIPRRLLTIYDFLFVSLFVLSVFFPVQHTLLDGRKALPVPFFEAAKQFACLFGVLFFVRLFLLKRPAGFKAVRMAVLIMAALFIFHSVVSMEIDYRKIPAPADEAETTAPEPLGEKNVVLLIVETLQGDYVEELALNSPELFDSFTGMTLFPNAVTSTAWSPFSTVQIFAGGNIWSGHGTRASAVAALNEDSLITTSRNSGFRFSGGTYTPIPGRKYASEPGDNLSGEARRSSIVMMHAKYYFASLRRVMPAVFWNWLRRREFRISRRSLSAGQYPAKIADRDRFLGLTDALQPGGSNAFLYFFNYMTHVEILFDRDGNAAPGLPQNKQSQLDEYVYAFKLYSRFLDKLKNIGAYDDSLIIVAGDHGAYNEPNRKFNPALFIKPPGSKGKLAISQATILHTDIRPLIEAYMSGGGGDALFGEKFLSLSQNLGPRKIRVYTSAGRNFDDGSTYRAHDVFGDIETVIRTLKSE